MASATRMAFAFMLAAAVVQANQCSGGGECPGDEEPANGVSLLQTNFHANVLEEHKRIALHPQEASAYKGSSLLQKELKTTVSPAKLPRVLHVATKFKFGEFPERLSWERQNPGWRIDFLTDERIEGLFRQHYPTKRIEEVAKIGVEKADIGRWLALLEGGVYVDNDVQDFVPIDQWSERFGYKLDDIDVMLGVEFPRAARGNPFQITNWAMAAKPGNSLVRRIVEKIVEEAPGIPDEYSNIISRTGPAASTSAVLQVLARHGLNLPPISEFDSGQGHLFSVPEKDSHMQLLILPYRAFGYNYNHGDDVVKLPLRQRLVRHKFKGSWKR